ncbi:MAG: SigB/SigF/SigG family RNA polymerase sigma factor [Candidatus Nanopelagicales bacterium]
MATLGALSARPAGLPIVSTFNEQSATSDAEALLVREVDAVVALSSAEQEVWRQLGARVMPGGPFAVPEPAAVPTGIAGGGHVMCMSTGEDLRRVVASMPFWAGNRLLIANELSMSVRATLNEQARLLGVRDRIDYRPGLLGQDCDHFWRDAAVLVAGHESARHGSDVLDAAAHAVPSIALAEGAHLDHVVPGSTGVLLARDVSDRELGHAIRDLLDDPLRCRGMGSAALLRVKSLHEHSALGQGLLAVYRHLMGEVAEKHPAAAAAPRLTEQGTQLALEHLPLARQLARRYAGRGQRLDDLVQVASLGLVRAASRFDPEFGKPFHSFAVPTILGELRRHFRDHAWATRVPRSLQETTMKVQRALDQMRVERGQDVTAADVAEELGLAEEEVLQAMQTRGEAMTSKSLDHPVGENGAESFGDLIGGTDTDLEYVESREAVRAALRKLPDREREILLMRFYGEHTQSEIAEQLGLSQVHVSRLIARTLAALRAHVMHDVALPTSWEPEGGPPESDARQRRAA